MADKNLKLGQYESLGQHAIGKFFTFGGAKYLFYLKNFKPFCIDKMVVKINEDVDKRELEAKSLQWMMEDIVEKSEKVGAKWINDQAKKMKEMADKGDLDGFWQLHPEFKQNVDMFILDYYKIFPEAKPSEESLQEVVRISCFSKLFLVLSKISKYFDVFNLSI